MTDQISFLPMLEPSDTSFEDNERKASHYAEMVDAGMRERRLRRAFYKACANWAHIAVAFFSSYVTKDRWRWMELKCLKKVEEYK